MKKRAYNLYYGSIRLNTTPITEDELATIKKTTNVVRKFGKDGKMSEIPLSKIKAVKCNIV